MSTPSEHLHSKAPGSAPAQPWVTSLFGCFSPFSTCLVGCCVPCATYGKTRHRVRNNGDLGGYSCCNGSCLLFCGAGMLCLAAIPAAMQRSDIRHKYNLEGNCCTDVLKACCCACCDVIQQDKEVADREGKRGAVEQQYQAPGGMTYPVKQ